MAESYRVKALREGLPPLKQRTGPDTVDKGYGYRYDGAPKGEGYLGLLPNSSGQNMSEYSVGLPIQGIETEMPSIVPTLSKEEIDIILNMKEGDRLPEEIMMKSKAHALKRMRAGQSPFYD